jgi:hypothetical protein
VSSKADKGEFFSEFVGCERIPRVAPRSSLLDASGNVIERSDYDVRKDPPLWVKKGGQSFLGKKFSQCPADYLRYMASFAEWKAGKDHEQKVLAKNGKLKHVYGCYESSCAAGWANLIEEFGSHDQTEPEQAPQPGPFPHEADAAEPNVVTPGDDEFPF